MKRVFTLLLLWLCWGFFLGTLILLGPMRWTVTYARSNNWTETSENWIAYFFIGVLCIISFLLAFFSSKFLMSQNAAKWKQFALVGVPFAGALFALYAFLNPGMINDNTEPSEKIGKHFAIGPYPELAKLYELKAEGYTSVISLLHPAVVPFEPSLLLKEKENAQTVGLEFISIPFLPWISENKEAIDSLRRVVNTGTGKYYIHCYLGRDRTSVASRIVQQENQQMVSYGSKLKDDQLLDNEMERGKVFELEKDIFLSPQPTKEEYLDVVDDFQQVVFIGDLGDPANATQLKTEKEWLDPFKIPLSSFSINDKSSNQEILDILKKIKDLPKPIFIHTYLGNTTQIEKIKTLYMTELKDK